MFKSQCKRVFCHLTKACLRDFLLFCFLLRGLPSFLFKALFKENNRELWGFCTENLVLKKGNS